MKTCFSLGCCFALLVACAVIASNPVETTDLIFPIDPHPSHPVVIPMDPRLRSSGDELYGD